MKLKLDEKGQVVVVDGKPVYVHDDGKEVAFDAAGAVTKIKELSEERDTLRTDLGRATDTLKPFEGFDLEKAKKALEVVGNLDAKKLIDAGEVDKIRTEAQSALSEQIKKLTEERRAEVDRLNAEIYDLSVGQQFATSKYVTEIMRLPPDLAKRAFSSHFERKDGKVIAYVGEGEARKPIFSRQKPGEYADFDEAIQELVEAHPQKDKLINGTGASGSGTPALQRRSGAGAFTISRADAQDPQKYQAAKAAAEKAGVQFGGIEP